MFFTASEDHWPSSSFIIQFLFNFNEPAWPYVQQSHRNWNLSYRLIAQKLSSRLENDFNESLRCNSVEFSQLAIESYDENKKGSNRCDEKKLFQPITDMLIEMICDVFDSLLHETTTNGLFLFDDWIFPIVLIGIEINFPREYKHRWKYLLIKAITTRRG